MKRASRRSFIKKSALAGIAAGCLNLQETLTASETALKNSSLKKGAVFLFQGDSITDGNRGRNEDPNHIMGHGFAFSIAGRIGADYPEKNYRFFNRGISGNKIIDLEKRWQTDTLDLQPDVLSILIGINDSTSVVNGRHPVVTTSEYEETYNSLLEQTLKTFPQILPVLCEPFILNVGKVADNWKKYHEDVVQRQTIVRELSKKYQAVFISFQEVFNEACKKAPAEYWIWDGIHPTVAGHEIMAREWLKQVKNRISF
jgi:lysophospholipase L1-like esterase